MLRPLVAQYSSLHIHQRNSIHTSFTSALVNGTDAPTRSQQGGLATIGGRRDVWGRCREGFFYRRSPTLLPLVVCTTQRSIAQVRLTCMPQRPTTSQRPLQGALLSCYGRWPRNLLTNGAAEQHRTHTLVSHRRQLAGLTPAATSTAARSSMLRPLAAQFP